MSWLSALLPPTEERFARWLMRALEARGQGPYSHDPAERVLRSSDGKVIFLDNLFAEFVHTSRWNRPGAIRSIASGFELSGVEEPTLEEALPNLVPRVRDRLFVELLPTFAPGIDVPWSPLTDHFALSLAIDMPEAVRDVTQSDLDRWGKTFDELLPVAKHRLAQASDPLRFVEVARGVLRSAWNDVYDASRVAVPGLFRSLGVRGKPVVTMPNRNSLLVAGSDDPEALLALIALTGDVLEREPRPQTGRPLILDGLEWVPFEPTEPRVSAAVERRTAIDRARDQAEQKAALEAAFAKTGRDCFVATATLVQKDDGRLESYCVWVEGVDDALLPHTDVVVFGMGGDKPESFFRVPFEVVLELLPHRMTAQGSYPERWHTTTFPSDEELATLRARALPD
ncbi:MAG: hypothetical protein U0230_01510 [Polyangiales bacterium]